MPIAKLSTLLADAQQAGYAVCYCESWNLESLQAVIEAAEDSRSPIIAGFNGGFLRHHTRRHPENLAYYAAFRQAIATARVPVAFLLNESDSLDQIREGIDLGFNAVMPENEGLELDAYRRLVRAVVEYAKPRNIWVEAQIGTLPAGHVSRNGYGTLTDPVLARNFVSEMEIDALAVSVGNVHILTQGKATLNFDTLRAVRDHVQVPLVLHGGTSLAPEDLRKAIQAGVSKVNFGTVLKQAYLEAVRQSLAAYHPPLSPHDFLGKGGPKDIMLAGREAVKREVIRLMEICGSKNREAYDCSTRV